MSRARRSTSRSVGLPRRSLRSTTMLMKKPTSWSSSGFGAAGHRRAQRDVGALAGLVQCDRDGGLQQHELGDAELAAELGELGAGGAVDAELDGVALAARHRRPREVRCAARSPRAGRPAARASNRAAPQRRPSVIGRAAPPATPRSRRTAPAAARKPVAGRRGAPGRRSSRSVNSTMADQWSAAMWCTTSDSTCASGRATAPRPGSARSLSRSNTCRRSLSSSACSHPHRHRARVAPRPSAASGRR